MYDEQLSRVTKKIMNKRTKHSNKTHFSTNSNDIHASMHHNFTQTKEGH